MAEDSIRDGLKAQIRETIAAKPNTVAFSQGHHDAIVKTLPAIIAGTFRALAEAQVREIAELKRQVAGLIEKDASRIERIREAAEEGRRRAMAPTEHTNTEPVEHDGQT